MKEKFLHLFTNKNMERGKFILAECDGFSYPAEKAKTPINPKPIMSGNTLADRWMGRAMINIIAKTGKDPVLIHAPNEEIVFDERIR